MRTPSLPVTRWRWWAIGLSALVLALYAPVAGFDFVRLDDARYLTANPHLGQGLSWATFNWAWTSTYFGWWHPMTWLSHLVDVSLFQGWAGGHHLTSAALHAANAGLLVAVLVGFGVHPRLALLVAAVVALHPTRVESVAWLSERKDVLSETLLLLTALAWQRFQLKRTWPWYLLTLVVFFLSLAAKTMGVTFPLLLLIIDQWRDPQAWRRARALVPEKLPLFVVSVVLGFTTVYAQHAVGAMQSVTQLGFGERLAAVPIAWAWYLYNSFVPASLCPYYERFHPEWWQVSGAVAALVALGLICRASWPRFRPLAFGLLFGAVGLLPVIGLLQVGGQLISDRYLYLVHPALFFGLASSVPVHWWTERRLIAGALSAGVLLALAGATSAQLPVWRDSEALYAEMGQCAPDAVFSMTGRGLWLLKTGRPQEALEPLTRAAARDSYARALYGRALLDLGRRDEGLIQVDGAFHAQPTDNMIRLIWTEVFAREGARVAAEHHLVRAERILFDVAQEAPDNAEVRRLLANVREDLARSRDAGASP